MSAIMIITRRCRDMITIKKLLLGLVMVSCDHSVEKMALRIFTQIYGIALLQGQALNPAKKPNLVLNVENQELFLF